MFAIKSLFLSIAALCIAIALCVGIQSISTFSKVNDALVSCQEDNPCWDCATMGNHICGAR